ncbi:MAG: hypothetical protein AAF745_04565 [Planctomycetota bacterium]
MSYLAVSCLYGQAIVVMSAMLQIWNTGKHVVDAAGKERSTLQSLQSNRSWLRAFVTMHR